MQGTSAKCWYTPLELKHKHLVERVTDKDLHARIGTSDLEYMTLCNQVEEYSEDMLNDLLEYYTAEYDKERKQWHRQEADQGA